MESREEEPSRQGGISRRMLIFIWLWGIGSLFAIGAVLYQLVRERKPLLGGRSRRREAPR